MKYATMQKSREGRSLRSSPTRAAPLNFTFGRTQTQLQPYFLRSFQGRTQREKRESGSIHTFITLPKVPYREYSARRGSLFG
jgi:hypothetical protein